MRGFLFKGLFVGHWNIVMDALLTTWLPLVVAFAVACVAAITDVVAFRVHNILTLPLIASGLAYQAAVGGWTGFSTGLLGMLFGFAVLIVPWLLGLMGAGDVKLLAGVGTWLGMPAVAFAFAGAAMATGIYAFALIIYRGRIRESLLMIKVILYRFLAIGMHFGKEDILEACLAQGDKRLRVIPFGAMVPIGIVAALVWLRWIKG
jgi:prepilin peptidase CpaA